VGPTRTYLLDTNLFVAAITKPRKETDTFRFRLGLIGRDRVIAVWKISKGNPSI